jgi:hypothetical protein
LKALLNDISSASIRNNVHAILHSMWVMLTPVRMDAGPPANFTPPQKPPAFVHDGAVEDDGLDGNDRDDILSGTAFELQDYGRDLEDDAAERPLRTCTKRPNTCLGDSEDDFALTF